MTPAATWTPGVGAPVLAELQAAMERYVLVDDFDTTLAVLACAVSTAEPAEGALWLMVVGPSSGGKTEPLRLLEASGLALKRDDLTVAGLLGVKTKRIKGVGEVQVKQGLLWRIGDTPNAMISIADFSTILGDPTSSSEAKARLFAILRRVHDGSVDRENYEGEVDWTGRVTLVAACTTVIDRFTSHNDALGPRWIPWRLRAQADAAVRRTADFALRRTGLGPNRRAAAEVAQRAVAGARERLPGIALGDDDRAAVVELATTAALARTSVPRAQGGHRDILEAPEPEMPYRLAGELGLMMRSMYALGLRPSRVCENVRRAAESCMPELRAKLLRHLQDSGSATAPSCARYAECDAKTATRCLEDLEVLGLVGNATAAGLAETKHLTWFVAADHAEAVKRILGGMRAQRRDSKDNPHDINGRM